MLVTNDIVRHRVPGSVYPFTAFLLAFCRHGGAALIGVLCAGYLLIPHAPRGTLS